MSAAFVNAVGRRLRQQSRFGFGFAPGLVRDAAECETRLLDAVAVELHRGRDRHQRKRVGQPVRIFR